MMLLVRRVLAAAGIASLLASGAVAGANRWTTSGPADLAYVASVAPHPTVPLRAACYRSYRGVYVTEDGGATWTPRNHGLHDDYTYLGVKVAWDPDVPLRLYCIGSGFYRSDDEGLTWTRLASGIQWSRIAGLLTDSTTPGRLLVAKDDGVWESRDSGQTWRVLSARWPGGTVSGIAFSPADPALVYASFRAPRGQGVWRFDASSGGWASANGGIDPGCMIWDVAASPMDAARAFATESCTGAGSVFLRTSDGGATWQVAPGAGLPSVFLSPVVVDPAGGTAVYVADIRGEVYRSDDSGDTWTPFSSGIAGDIIRDIAVSPADSRRVMVGTDVAGTWTTPDGGSTWMRAASGLDGSLMRTLSVDATDPTLVLASNLPIATSATASVPDLFRSSDACATWEVVPNDRGAVFAITAVPGTRGEALASIDLDPFVYRTSDAGTTWSPSATGLPQGFSGYPLRVDPLEPMRAFAVQGNFGDLYRSTDGGATWSPSMAGLVGESVFWVAFDQTTRGRVVVSAGATVASLVDTFVTSDGGASWTRGPVSPWGGTTVLAVRGSRWYGVTYLGTRPSLLFRYDEVSGTWTDISAGLPAVDPLARLGFTDVVIEPGDPDALIVSLFGEGIWRSPDGGASWCPLNRDPMDYSTWWDGLEVVGTTPMTIHSATSNGVWSLTLDDSDLLLMVSKTSTDAVMTWGNAAFPVTVRRGESPQSLRPLAACVDAPYGDRVIGDRRLYFYSVGY